MRLTNRIKQAGATGIHFTLATRNSDSDFTTDLSGAGLPLKLWERARLIENLGMSKNQQY
jgi:hypothetical protein